MCPVPSQKYLLWCNCCLCSVTKTFLLCYKSTQRHYQQSHVCFLNTSNILYYSSVVIHSVFCVIQMYAISLPSLGYIDIKEISWDLFLANLTDYVSSAFVLLKNTDRMCQQASILQPPFCAPVFQLFLLLYPSPRGNLLQVHPCRGDSTTIKPYLFGKLSPGS